MMSIGVVVLAVCVLADQALGGGTFGTSRGAPAYKSTQYYERFPGQASRYYRSGAFGLIPDGIGRQRTAGAGRTAGQGVGQGAPAGAGSRMPSAAGPRMSSGAGQRMPSGAGQGTPAGSSVKLPVPERYVNPQDAVAFSAVRTTDKFFYRAGPLAFDDVITNLGGGYNSEYGIFTAPYPGLYSINYHVVSKPGSQKPAHVDLLRNSQVINSAKGSGESGTPSNSAVVYLDQFDMLSISGRTGTVVGCESNGFCSFNVVLIKLGKFTDQKLTRAFPMDKW